MIKQTPAILTYNKALNEFGIETREQNNWNHTGGEYINTLTIKKGSETYSIRLSEYNRESGREKVNTIQLTIEEFEKYLTLINQPKNSL